jgi:ketosteroid isomerase-like protein
MKNKSALRVAVVAATTFLLLGIPPSYAGDDTVRAEAYFQAITSGDTETIASFYADNAEFRWIGGPLAGFYKGKDDIKGVWKRFSAAAGKFTHEVLELNETPEGKGSTVNARVAFKGATDVPVKFILTYRDGKITSETWQVDKGAATVAKVEPKTEPAEVKPETVATAAPKVEAKPETPETKVETIATAQSEPVQSEPAPTPEQKEPEAKPQKSDNTKSDYLPKSSKAPATATPKVAAPNDAKPAPKTKSGDARKGPRKKRYYYDDDDVDYDDYDDYAYAPRYRRYRGWDDYGYGYGGGYRGYFGGPFGFYGRY